ncbi:MarR family winged helix-turn-helix transcriptional regulator [Taibaiella soli]|uniref:MarR family transcriptional regulator n=1 Tax=Taibaiella soli TaxID=1649169 RepID=A0A2W2A9E5_9BACT|nr:MarR family transcriptional regulator [Taibaiella soli]PZF71891.1 MarR family transcriptional regulator [Taibaiella soli]
MNQELITQVRRLSQQYAYASIQMHEAVAKRVGLPGTDHKYLGFLLQNGQMTAGELATISGLTTGAVTGLIDRLEQRKLVKRQPAADDRRKIMIVPDTKKIMAILEPLYKDFRKESEELLASFSEKEINVIETYFQKAVAIMNKSAEQIKKKPSSKKKSNEK